MSEESSLTMNLNLVKICLWNHAYDDRPDFEYYEMPYQTLALLKSFVDTGHIPAELRDGLDTALNYFPLWEDYSLSDLVSEEQRETIVGRFVTENGRRVELVFDISFNMNLY